MKHNMKHEKKRLTSIFEVSIPLMDSIRAAFSLLLGQNLVEACFFVFQKS